MAVIPQLSGAPADIGDFFDAEFSADPTYPASGTNRQKWAYIVRSTWGHKYVDWKRSQDGDAATARTALNENNASRSTAAAADEAALASAETASDSAAQAFIDAIT